MEKENRNKFLENYCQKCSIENKLIYCCRENPLTGERKKMKVGSKYHWACPELDKKGECGAYSHIHKLCREYRCDLMIEQLENEAKERYLLRDISEFKAKPLALSDPKK